MMIRERIVMKIDVRTEDAVDVLTFMKKFTRDSEASKIVCLQEKAIVKPRVIVIRRRTWCLNSFRKWSPPTKKLWTFCLICLGGRRSFRMFRRRVG
jgi:hypothetical protein